MLYMVPAVNSLAESQVDLGPIWYPFWQCIERNPKLVKYIHKRLGLQNPIIGEKSVQFNPITGEQLAQLNPISGKTLVHLTHYWGKVGTI